jgi:hypothetical protein
MVILINGEAGTGKTYLINEIKKRFPKVRTSATTWVAGKLTLSETFYRALNLKPADFSNPNFPIKLKTRSPLVIDEASMISREQLIWLKSHFPNACFILVGDFNQLPPVNGTQIKQDDLDFVITLNVQQRQKDIKLHDFIDRLKNNRLSNSDFTFIKERTITKDDACNNNLFQIAFTNNCKNDYNDTISFESEYPIGRKLIARAFYYSDIYINREGKSKKIYAPKNCWWVNNEIVEIIGKTPEYIKVRTGEGKEQRIYSNEKLWWTQASSLTCHKVQGQTLTSNIVINLDDLAVNRNIEMRTRLLYVAVSRAVSMDQLYFIGDMFNIFPLVSNYSPIWTGSNDDLLEELRANSDSKFLGYLFNCLNQTKMVSVDIHNSYMAVKCNHLLPQALAELCGVSRTMIMKLKKKGLTNEQIYIRYNPEAENEECRQEAEQEIAILEGQIRQEKEKYNNYFKIYNFDFSYERADDELDFLREQMRAAMERLEDYENDIKRLKAMNRINHAA